MSLINDALKQARKAQPRSTPNALPPLQPVADEPSPVAAWLVPAIVIVLIVGAIFFIGWSVARHNVHEIVSAPDPAATQQVSSVTLPVVTHLPPPPPPPVNPPDAPKLQAIFYIPGKPTAIIEGKSVKPGDQFGIYRVKAISKTTVILVGPDKKEIQISPH